MSSPVRARYSSYIPRIRSVSQALDIVGLNTQLLRGHADDNVGCHTTMWYPHPIRPLIDGPTPPSQVLTTAPTSGAEEQQMINPSSSLNVRLAHPSS